eukprot:g41191.t1
MYRNGHLRVINVYTPLVKREQLAVLQHLPLLLAKSRPVILAGDFNCIFSAGGSTNIRPLFFSDHCLLLTICHLQDDQWAGKGTWKLNVKLLAHCPEHIEELKIDYTGWRAVKPLFESPAGWRETVKGNIKRFFILKA